MWADYGSINSVFANGRNEYSVEITFMQSIIMHLDMNSYFASVEQQDCPAWRGKPVGVCEHLGGIIIGASVEAKKWGITTGAPVWEARKLYPKIILTHTRPEAYRFYTRKFLKVVGDYTGLVEKYSIDECFLDLTKVCNVKISGKLPQADPWEEAVNIARQIKHRFKTEVGDWLRCSIGIADNKTVAKIASDMRKPDGLVVVLPDAGQGRIGPIEERPISIAADRRQAAALRYGGECLVLSKERLYRQLALIDVPGIGRRQERNLGELGIKTLSDLRDYPRSRLVARFGPVMGYHLHSLGRLQSAWKAPVADDEEIKSMGHMYTLPQEYRQREFFMPVLYKLCEMVARRLRRKDLTGNVLHFFAHDKQWQGFGRSLKLGYFLQDGREAFLEIAGTLRSEFRIPDSVRIIGVTIAGLRPRVNQLSLFGDAERERRLAEALDKINDKYGEFSISRAQIIKAGKVFRDSVGFGRIKEL